MQRRITEIQQELTRLAGRKTARLEQVLEDLHQTRSYDLSILAVTDVALHHSMILAVGQDAGHGHRGAPLRPE